MTTAHPINDALVTDLRLTLENTGSLYPRLNAVHKALLVRKRKGTYQAAKAGKAFAPIVATAAKQYMRDVQGSRITPAERVAVCEELRKHFEQRAALGELDWLLPASMQGVGFSEIGVGAEFHLTPGGQKFKKTGDRTFVGADGKALKVKRGARRRVHRAKKKVAKKAASSAKRKPKAKKPAKRKAAKRAKGKRSARVGSSATRAWAVYLNGKHVDTVFYSDGIDAADVKRQLVQHDGYDANIVVRKKAKLPKSAQGIGGKPKRARVGEVEAQLRPGYMYICDSTDWRRSSDEAWETEMRSDVSGAKYVGQRRIDGVMCRVFQLTGGKVPTYAAATLAATEGL